MIDPPGSPGQIASLASSLATIAASTKTTAAGAQAVADKSTDIGHNSVSAGLKANASKAASAISGASSQVSSVSATVQHLSQQIARLQNQTTALGPSPSTLNFVAYELHATRVQNNRHEADQYRTQARRAIENSAGKTILTTGYHYKHWYSYVGDFFGGAKDGVEDLVGGLWSMVRHPMGFIDGMTNLATSFWHHPGATWSATWRGVVDPQLLKKDPARWLGHVTVDVVSLLIPGTALKMLSKSEKAAAILGGSSEVVEGLADSKAITSSLDRAQKVFEERGLPKINVDDLNALAKSGEVAATGLPASTTIVAKGYQFVTDKDGNLSSISGQLHLARGDAAKAKVRDFIRSQGLSDDDAGHMIARIFDGPYDNFNLVPQNFNLNRGAWRAMEKQWAKALDPAQPGGPHKVEVDIRPIREPGEARPDEFIVTWTDNGGPTQRRIFENVDQKTLDR